MSNKYVKIFNDHFQEFLDDVQSVFPDDLDIEAARNGLIALRKANPKLIPVTWRDAITAKYEEQIMQDNISFFIEKDYSDEVRNAEYADKIMEAVNRLRVPIAAMSDENKTKVALYMKNLTVLSKMIT